MKTIIHVNQHVIKRNRKYDRNDPCLTVKTYKDNRYGHDAVIMGHDGEEVARIVYRPDKPLPCGAHCWIETKLIVDVQLSDAPPRKRFTSDDLAALEIEEFQTLVESPCRYRMTDGEMGWLEWIGSRYAIADVVRANIRDIESDDGEVEHWLVLNDDSVWEIGDALSGDHVDRAPCLSEDTMLQRLIWYIGPHVE